VTAGTLTGVVLSTDNSSMWAARMLEHVPDHLAEHIVNSASLLRLIRKMKKWDNIGHEVAEIDSICNGAKRDEPTCFLVLAQVQSRIYSKICSEA
jgi:hypothetical protein